jgi:hypothetical protein
VIALGDLFWVAIALGAALAGWLTLRRASPRRRRQEWIEQRMAEAEALAPGGRFSDDEYLLRLEAYEEEWEERHGL